MRRINIFFLFFLTSHITISAQSKIDSLAIKSIHEIIDASNALYYTKTDSALLLAELAFEKASEIGYQKGMADALTTVGIAYDIFGDLGMSMLNHKKAFDIYDKAGDSYGKANCQYNIALILSQNGEYDEALKYATASRSYYSAHGYKWYEANTISHIGEVMTKKGEALSECVEKFEEARSIYVSLDNIPGQCGTYNLQGDAYFINKKPVQAILYYSKAAELLGDLDKPWYMGYSYMGLAKSYLQIGRISEAYEMVEKGIDQYKLINHVKGIMDLYLIKTNISEKSGNLQASLDNLRLHQLYKDSLYNDKQSKQMNLLKTQFESERKEAEIASLSQQASIQALEIKQKNQALLIGLIVFLFILAAIYFFYKQREIRKQHGQTELEQRFLRSQLNPHFISNALVAVQSFMLKNDSESAALYLTKFSKLMREILENSRREFISVEEEISMLKNYMDINQQRLGSFEYSIEVDDAIDPEIDTIPPMFVQPFVENAVEHGIGNRTEGGKIDVKFKKEGDFITIEVSDNGKGLVEPSDISHKSLSTTIIQERMSAFNRTLKRKIQLVMDNWRNENGEVSGTRVELKVPFG